MKNGKLYHNFDNNNENNSNDDNTKNSATLDAMSSVLQLWFIIRGNNTHKACALVRFYAIFGTIWSILPISFRLNWYRDIHVITLRQCQWYTLNMGKIRMKWHWRHKNIAQQNPLLMWWGIRESPNSTMQRDYVFTIFRKVISQVFYFEINLHFPSKLGFEEFKLPRHLKVSIVPTARTSHWNKVA